MQDESITPLPIQATSNQTLLFVGGREALWQVKIDEIQRAQSIHTADKIVVDVPPSIADLRQIIQRVQLKPLHGSRTLIVFYHLQLWSSELATTLLKTVEEPPRHATIVLCATEGAALLSTIRSRVTTIRLQDVVESFNSSAEAVIPLANSSLKDQFAAIAKLAESDMSATEIVKEWLENSQNVVQARQMLTLLSRIGTTPVNRRLALEAAALTQSI